MYQCDEAVDIKPRLCRVSYVKGDKVAVYWADLDMQLGYADKHVKKPRQHDPPTRRTKPNTVKQY